MSDKILCPAQTSAGRLHVDPEPPSYCEVEVEDYGDLCPDHDADARMDDDYDNYLENLWRERDL
jgi:hypothetical protein